jgi:hypothetical protein
LTANRSCCASFLLPRFFLQNALSSIHFHCGFFYPTGTNSVLYRRLSYRERSEQSCIADSAELLYRQVL